MKSKKSVYQFVLTFLAIGYFVACSQVPKKIKIEHPTAQPSLPISANSNSTTQAISGVPTSTTQTETTSPISDGVVGSVPVGGAAQAVTPTTNEASRPLPSIPKVGIILGPGGALGYAHIGVLQELVKQKVPVTAVAGVEWGSLFAALYSQKAAVNDVEWQMMKLKPDLLTSKSLLGGAPKPIEPTQVSEILKSTLQRSKAEEGRLPFACAALNFTKNQIYIMSKGPFDQLIPFCLAYPPVSKVWQGNISAIRETQVLADYLKSRGVNYVILVNVLPPPNPYKSVGGDLATSPGILWSEVASFYWRKPPGVDYVLNVFPQIEDSVFDFSMRREILQKGSQRAIPLVKELNRKLGL